MTSDCPLIRYDLVLHLKTAAEGAEPFYSTLNTTPTDGVRTETAEEARELDARSGGNQGVIKETRELDARIFLSWKRVHRSVVVIDNSTDLGQKVTRACGAVLGALRSVSTMAPAVTSV